MANNIDPAIKYTDDEIKELDKKIKEIYSEAESDIQKKMDDFTAKYQKKDAEYQKQLKEGKITQTDYDAWKKGQVFTGKQWKAKKDEMSAVLHNSNKIATSMVNKSMFNVFSENGNYMAYSIEHNAGANFGFGLYNTEAVTRLIKDDPEILPKWNVNATKDYVWNQQNLNRAVTQGIIQGESLDKISKRVSTGLAAKNENLMKTFAKTGMTEAQNAGRLERMREAKALGIDIKKKWTAVLDERTRINHRELDGQIIDIEEPFEAGGLKIMYPGDKTAHPSMVYNCRCALNEDFAKYPSTYNRYDNIAGKPIKGMSYNEWKEAKDKGDDLTPVPLTYKTFKNKEQKMLEDLFKTKTMSALYSSIKALDSKTASQFYKILGENDKPSDGWKHYIEGTMPSAQAKKVDAILKKYGEDSGLIKEPINVSDAFKGKKMSNVFNEIKAVDNSASNKFYNDLKSMGKPSEVWEKYLANELDDVAKLKIDSHLEKYLKKIDNDVTINKLDFLKSKYNLSDTSDLAAALWQDQKVYDQISSKNIGSPWKYLSDYVDDKIDDPDIDKIVGIAKAAKKVETAADKAEDTIKLEKAKKKLAATEKDLKDKFDMDTTYSGIWKEDVTLADYEAKKGKIAAKKKYFEDQIDKYSGPAYANSSWAPKEIEKFEDLLQGLEEFEEEGKAASKYLKAVEAAKKEVRALTPVGDMFSDARKGAALWARDGYTGAKSNKEYLALDKIYDSWASPIHSKANAGEKAAYRAYTDASGGFNRPLVGYKPPYAGMGAGGWDPSYYVGRGKVDFDNEGKGKQIKNLTSFIGKSHTTNDMWIQTGHNYATFEGKEGFLGIDFGTLEKLSDNELQQFVGTVAELPQFISGSINKGGGSYVPGDMILNIYVPEGSEALYVLSDGVFGKNEHEMILQRGGTYRITNVYRGKDHRGEDKIFWDIELHSEMGYDKFEN